MSCLPRCFWKIISFFFMFIECICPDKSYAQIAVIPIDNLWISQRRSLKLTFQLMVDELRIGESMDY